MIGAQGYYEYLAGHTAAMDLNAYATRDLSEWKRGGPRQAVRLFLARGRGEEQPRLGVFGKNGAGGGIMSYSDAVFFEVEKRDWRNVKKWYLSMKALKLKGKLTVENPVENVNNSL